MIPSKTSLVLLILSSFQSFLYGQSFLLVKNEKVGKIVSSDTKIDLNIPGSK